MTRDAPAGDEWSAVDRFPERLGGAPASISAAEAPLRGDAADVRTLAVRFDASGPRFRDYAGCIALASEDTIEGWPLDVRRTLRAYADLIRRPGGARTPRVGITRSG